MILGTRLVDTPGFRGINIFLLKDWVMPIDQLGLNCFDSFDESVLRLKFDDEATRILPSSLKSKEVGMLNTATEAALRSIPERFRTATSLFTVAQSLGDPLKFYFLMPPWAHLSVEKKNGDLHRLHTSPAKIVEWTEVKLEADDEFLHLGFFSHGQMPRLDQSTEAHFYRLSTLIDNLNFRHLMPSVALRVSREAA